MQRSMPTTIGLTLVLSFLWPPSDGLTHTARAGVDYTIQAANDTLPRATITFDSSVASAVAGWSFLGNGPANLGDIDAITLYNIPGLVSPTVILPTPLNTSLGAGSIGSQTGRTMDGGHIFVTLNNPTTRMVELDFDGHTFDVFQVTGPQLGVGGIWLQANGLVPVVSTPEPASVVMLGMGLVAVVVARGMAGRRWVAGR